MLQIIFFCRLEVALTREQYATMMRVITDILGFSKPIYMFLSPCSYLSTYPSISQIKTLNNCLER